MRKMGDGAGVGGWLGLGRRCPEPTDDAVAESGIGFIVFRGLGRVGS